MNEQILSKRYGDGYALFVKNYMEMDVAAEEVIKFKRLLVDFPDLLAFLQNAAISAREKCLVVDRIFKDNFSNELNIFLKLLIEKEETKKLNEILEYIRITYLKGASVNAVLTSTYPLDSDVIEKIKEHMEIKTKKKPVSSSTRSE